MIELSEKLSDHAEIMPGYAFKSDQFSEDENVAWRGLGTRGLGTRHFVGTRQLARLIEMAVNEIWLAAPTSKRTTLPYLLTTTAHLHPCQPGWAIA